MWLFSIWVYLIFKTVSHLNYANESYDGFTQMTNYSLYIEHVSLNRRASSSNCLSKPSLSPLKSGSWLPARGRLGSPVAGETDAELAPNWGWGTITLSYQVRKLKRDQREGGSGMCVAIWWKTVRKAREGALSRIISEMFTAIKLVSNRFTIL